MYIASEYINLRFVSGKETGQWTNKVNSKKIHGDTVYFLTVDLTGPAHYMFNAHELILVIFGRDVAERVRYRVMTCIPPLLTNVSALPEET